MLDLHLYRTNDSDQIKLRNKYDDWNYFGNYQLFWKH